ncbi:MAG: hypothetical protein J6T10_00320 [Methanobrevibacter sp.]|nr:hypothetical protein [Methanobrevibacter sp.]
MAVLTKEELNQRLADRFGQTEDESDISFMEDITDTFANLETNANAEQLKDLQTKYSELQKKYRDRFFNTGDDSGNDDDVFKPTPDPEPKVLKFEDLFS